MTRHEPWPTEFNGDCIVRNTTDGGTIQKADPAILISVELLQAAAAGAICVTFDGNILTIPGTNATVRYWVDNPATVVHPGTSDSPQWVPTMVEAKRIPVPICPECAQEKHGDCVEEALDELSDGIGPCMCSHIAWENR